MEIVHTRWGPMERWRAVALCIGEVSNVVNAAARNDELERKYADAAERARADAYAAKRRQYYDALYARCDAAEARCDALLAREQIKREARERADAAMREAEERFTSTEPEDDE
jgi:hypothetical protein